MADPRPAADIQAAMIEEVTLDGFLDRDPREVDYAQLVPLLRRDRAAFIAKREKAAAKRRGNDVEEEEEE